MPQFTEYKEEFVELENDLLRNKCSLSEANEAISQLTNQNKELQRKLSKFERKSNGGRERLDEITTKLQERDDELNDLTNQYREILDHKSQYEQKCDELVNLVTNLENKISTLNGKSVAQTETNLGT